MYYIIHFKKNPHPSPNTPPPPKKTHNQKSHLKKNTSIDLQKFLQPRFSAENCLQDFAVDIDEEFMDISMASEDLMFLG